MVLVVDDHAETRYVFTMLLERLGYDAIAVVGGQAAIDFLGSTIPELIILDCNMQCVDGLGVLRAVRADPRLTNVPVVIFSADTKDCASPAYEKLGVQDWIVKGTGDRMKIDTIIGKYAVPSQRIKNPVE